MVGKLQHEWNLGDVSYFTEFIFLDVIYSHDGR